MVLEELIESMVVKTPVIASKVGGHRDIIKTIIMVYYLIQIKKES